MISYIRGELIRADSDGTVVVEAGGIGYEIRMPLSALDQLPRPGGEAKIHTFLQVRDDALALFGFLTPEDRQIFEWLLGVNGVGPKAALGVLSVMSGSDLQFAVFSGDEKAIAAAPGIGRKTAGKIILELKDKVKLEEAFGERAGQGPEGAPGGTSGNGACSEAAEALKALGYSSSEAWKAVRGVEGAGEMDVETILQKALRSLALF